jgi:hypothetical protein
VCVLSVRFPFVTLCDALRRVCHFLVCAPAAVWCHSTGSLFSLFCISAVNDSVFLTVAPPFPFLFQHFNLPACVHPLLYQFLSTQPRLIEITPQTFCINLHIHTEILFPVAAPAVTYLQLFVYNEYFALFQYELFFIVHTILVLVRSCTATFPV